MSMRDDFAVLILTHGRPDNVVTVNTLERCGYTGRIVIVVDDTDETVDQYRANFDEVVVFDKKAIAETFDTGDNFEDMRTIVYARNAAYEIALDLGLRWFIQLDDDYTGFMFRFNAEHVWVTKDITIRNLDRVLELMVEFVDETPAVTLAMAQGGDFIGGAQGSYGRTITLSRKAMNSFICDVENPIGFLGRVNEDVNTYTAKTARGELIFTTNYVCLTQLATQSNEGGMTGEYMESGTYVKSFYTVMYHPSAATVQAMTGGAATRLHHQVRWNETAPKIVRESVRKQG